MYNSTVFLGTGLIEATDFQTYDPNSTHIVLAVEEDVDGYATFEFKVVNSTASDIEFIMPDAGEFGENVTVGSHFSFVSAHAITEGFGVEYRFLTPREARFVRYFTSSLDDVLSYAPSNL